MSYGQEIPIFIAQVKLTCDFSPHHCVGFLFFAWIPPLSSVRRRAASLTHSLTVQIASWLPLAWQAQYTELPGGAAARWPPLARGCLLRGKRSTQSLLEELRRAWAPLAGQFAAEAKGIPWQRTRGGPRTRSNGRRSEFESSFYSTTAPCPNRLRP